MSDGHAQGILPTQLPVRPLHLHLLGRGDVANLRMPADIKNDTTVHFNLRFPQYYDQVSKRAVMSWDHELAGSMCELVGWHPVAVPQ